MAVVGEGAALIIARIRRGIVIDIILYEAGAPDLAVDRQFELDCVEPLPQAVQRAPRRTVRRDARRLLMRLPLNKLLAVDSIDRREICTAAS